MAYKSILKSCQIALAMLALFFVVTPAGALRVYLQDTDGNPLPVDARWRVAGYEEGIWYESGGSGTIGGVSADFTFYFQGKNVIWPSILTTNIANPDAATVTFQFPIYSNSISVIMNGPPTDSLVTWSFTAQPDALTNSTSYQSAYTNSFAIYDVSTNILTAIPHGTYKISPGAVQGYATPDAVITNIAGAPLTNQVSFTYVAYSNVITVTVYGFPTGNCEYTITGPADFTNATGYKAGYTNNATIASVPTGSYVFNFPGVLGYSTPTNTLAIIGDSLTNDVTATYVLAYPTNIPSGEGIQKFYQRSYFFTNVYLHDSGVPLHTRLGFYATGTPVYVESDPVWGTSSGAVLAVLAWPTGSWNEAYGWGDHGTNGYVTGTPVYVESDPVWGAASNQVQTDIVKLQIRTSVWEQAATDATSATGDVAGLQTRTSTWNQAAIDGAAATAGVAAVSGRVDNAEGAITTNAQNIGAISTRVDNAEGAITTNANNFSAHSNDTSNPHGVTPAQIGALAASSNLLDVADADIARSNLGAAAQADLEGIVSQTNQIIDVNGVAYTITNSPTAGVTNIVLLDAATTTGYFAAYSPGGAGGLTTNDVKNVAPLMTNSESIVIGKDASSGGGGSQNVAIGRFANAYSGSYNVDIGYFAGYGVANSYAANIGYESRGRQYSSLVGSYTYGGEKTVSIGSYANYAGGYSASAPSNNVAVGAYSVATTNSAALGAYVSNTIPGTTRIRGALYLDGGTKIYTRETFNSGEFSELATGGAAAGTYPVFEIKVGGSKTDFEIKASSNNFESLLYYYKSWTTNQDVSRGDTNALCYFTDDHAADVRVWHLKTQTNAISEMLASTNSEVETIYFYPSHDCAIPWGAWMSSTNTALVWSFVRVDDLGFEMNASGTQQHWNPIRPDSWDAARTVP